MQAVYGRVLQLVSGGHELAVSLTETPKPYGRIYIVSSRSCLLCRSENDVVFKPGRLAAWADQCHGPLDLNREGHDSTQ